MDKQDNMRRSLRVVRGEAALAERRVTELENKIEQYKERAEVQSRRASAMLDRVATMYKTLIVLTKVIPSALLKRLLLDPDLPPEGKEILMSYHPTRQQIEERIPEVHEKEKDNYEEKEIGTLWKS